LGSKRDVPESVKLVPNPREHNVAVFVDLEFLFIENSDAIIVTKLTNGNERGICNVIEDMGVLGFC
jgi:hypothetical protein